MTTEKTMRALLFALLSRCLRFIVINALRAIFIALAYLVGWSISLLELALLGIDWVAIKIDVQILSTKGGGAELNTPTFTEGEIELMAMRLPKGIDTIDKIAEHYTVSARQARKVKSALETRLNVNNYSVA